MRERVTASIKNVGRNSDLRVTINGNTFNNFDFNNGKLVATIPLKLGSNKIKVMAKNEGGSAEKSITITRTMGRPTISKGGKIGKDAKIGKRTSLTKAKS